LEERELPVGLHTGCELKEVKRTGSCWFRLTFYHHDTCQHFIHETEAVILATGYRHAVPAFVRPVRDRIVRDRQHRYSISRNYSIDRNGNEIFVQNAELHTHGFNAPDLSLGPYRNAVILKEITGYDYGACGMKNTFQQFGIPRNEDIYVS
jgi:lysine N6-hydroxylase